MARTSAGACSSSSATTDARYASNRPARHRGVQPTQPGLGDAAGRAVTSQPHRGTHPALRVPCRARQHPRHDRRRVQRHVPQPAVRLDQGAVLAPLRLDRRQPRDRRILRRRGHVDHPLRRPHRGRPLLPRPAHRALRERADQCAQRRLTRRPHLHRAPAHTLHPLPFRYPKPTSDHRQAPGPTGPNRLLPRRFRSAQSEQRDAGCATDSVVDRIVGPTRWLTGPRPSSRAGHARITEGACHVRLGLPTGASGRAAATGAHRHPDRR